MYRVFFSLRATPVSCLSPISAAVCTMVFIGLEGVPYLNHNPFLLNQRWDGPGSRSFQIPVYVCISTFKKRPTPLHARFKTQHEPHSFVAKQSRAITEMKRRGERGRAGRQGEGLISSKHMRTHNKYGEWGRRVKAWGAGKREKNANATVKRNKDVGNN